MYYPQNIEKINLKINFIELIFKSINFWAPLDQFVLHYAKINNVGALFQ